MPSKKYGIIVLAGGSSSRMGKLKALLPYQNTTLIDHILCECSKTTLPIIIVTGAHRAALEKVLSKFVTVYNSKWHDGIGSSIRFGLQELLKRIPDSKGVIFVNSDQPFVSNDLLKKIIDHASNTDRNIIASSYSGTRGIPAYFSKKYFNDLLALHGDSGAKKIIMANLEDVFTISFPKGAIDVDTPEDYIKLAQSSC